MRHAKCEWCQQVAPPAAQYCAACGMPITLSANGGIGTISGGAGAFLVAAALVSVGVLFWIFGAAVGIVLAGAALCVVFARLWWLRLPIRRYGAEISHSERPVAYHLCVAALFFFSALFLFMSLFHIVGAK